MLCVAVLALMKQWEGVFSQVMTMESGLGVFASVAWEQTNKPDITLDEL
ncbi:MAG: hypothetical protein Q8M98_03890 [Candidatus Cloacimonadaceae bacterium]|nr:hypothetical protein [Candidatus Cloacimonadaceae bacterium]MDP3113899.1 hypothetical protein [Candidatus Cloacimonadaceae bacterium]